MKAIREEIEKIKITIKWTEESLDKTVAEFKECTSRCSDSYDIIERLPGRIREIEEKRARLEALYEQMKMLEYLLRKSEE